MPLPQSYDRPSANYKRLNFVKPFIRSMDKWLFHCGFHPKIGLKIMHFISRCEALFSPLTQREFRVKIMHSFNLQNHEGCAIITYVFYFILKIARKLREAVFCNVAYFAASIVKEGVWMHERYLCRSVH